jgi:membrane-associated phospholipid phosphatase
VFFDHENKRGTARGAGFHPQVHTAGPVYHNKSFPSGHTNTAFGAAVFLVVLFGGKWYLSFVPALLVGYSRVYLGVHFPFDVAAGGLLGGVLTLLIMQILLYGKTVSISGAGNDKR